MVTVPGIEVVRHRRGRDQLLLGGAQRHTGLDLGGDREVRRIARGAQHHRRRQQHARHQHLLAQDLPGGRRLAHLVAQPGSLLRAHQLARRVRHVGSEGSAVEAAVRADIAGQGQLLVATDHARVEHVQRNQVAEIERAIDLVRLRRVRHADRHPLVIRLDRHLAPRRPQAFRGRVVVLGAAAPGVVGQFMVIPDGDEGHARMHRLQVGVGAVLLEADPVIGQRDDLGGRLRHAPQGARVLRGIAAGGVFVDVVAQVQADIDIVEPGGIGVHVEVAGRVVRAAEHGKAHARDAARRERLGTPHRRELAVAAEAVEIAAVGRQAGGIHFDREVAGAAGAQAARGHRTRKVARLRDLPADIDVGGAGGRDARPQDDAVGQRIAAGHAMREADGAVVAVTAAGRERERRHGDGAEGEGTNEIATRMRLVHGMAIGKSERRQILASADDALMTRAMHGA